MKKSYYLILTFLVLLSLSCKSSKSVASQVEVDNLNAIINSKSYRIESDWAYPQVTTAVQNAMNSGLVQPGSSSSSISLIGNSNFLEVKNDSVQSYLPYFGERRMQVGYGSSDSAIQFDGVVENYKVNPNKKGGYDISFEAQSKSEKFNVNITIFPNLNANIGVNGGSRLGIRYSGKVITK
ncbi:DUF4251 domain-containing protein [uncultured Algibacter sp.]|uniref:DUF4251 domain-containing protein n=1 Tax=uncultured Algibacter sp. TaxID=298659 RepID=UPI00261FC008|nr:DUF4251 domain-containing protein [uncultured Algibacter sp.]